MLSTMKFVVGLVFLAAAVAAQDDDSSDGDDLASCLSDCMDLAVSDSQQVQSNQFTSICRTYEETAECINSCNPSSRAWWQVGRDLIDNCNALLNTAINQNQPCYRRNLQRAQSSCDNKCSLGNGVSLWDDQNQDRYCFANNCFMDCLTSSLNRACGTAGTDLANVFFSPYDTIYNSPVLWDIYNDATEDVEPWCRPYFYDQQPGTGNNGGDGVGINSVLIPADSGSGGQSRPTLPANQRPSRGSK
ncbi:unnamed protein product [Bursaphelenchus xylophilus]|uniref:(pine wood nematode) hypothetical protein n=1 Tax=Bursaphelenchus xylophilus TaxID=6326 RepID=A0A1I7S6E5_BURXY|nr:unnamed protein product [Bursaphelenchus xylophilus]CAG9128072.1 unnamed protein product [Bursaphelenchus xylophilus]